VGAVVRPTRTALGGRTVDRRRGAPGRSSVINYELTMTPPPRPLRCSWREPRGLELLDLPERHGAHVVAVAEREVPRQPKSDKHSHGQQLAGLLPEGRAALPTGRNLLAAFQGLGLTYTTQGIARAAEVTQRRRSLLVLVRSPRS